VGGAALPVVLIDVLTGKQYTPHQAIPDLFAEHVLAYQVEPMRKKARLVSADQVSKDAQFQKLVG
jgi:hypothetical protein